MSISDRNIFPFPPSVTRSARATFPVNGEGNNYLLPSPFTGKVAHPKPLRRMRRKGERSFNAPLTAAARHSDNRYE